MTYIRTGVLMVIGFALVKCIAGTAVAAVAAVTIISFLGRLCPVRLL